jgi:hypothetical protein
LVISSVASFISPRAMAAESGLILAYRVSPPQWTGDAKFQSLLDVLGANPSGVDEVCLFDEVFPRSTRPNPCGGFRSRGAGGCRS